VVPFSCAIAGTDKKLIDTKAIAAVDFMIILLVTLHEVIVTTMKISKLHAALCELPHRKPITALKNNLQRYWCVTAFFSIT
jgi:hypothetical protein